MRTHYDNLKVARDAPQEVIRAAYQSLAQKYHPDRNPADPNAARILGIITTAYEVLSDPARRRAHDAWIAEQETTDVPASASAAKTAAAPRTRPVEPEREIKFKGAATAAKFVLGFLLGLLGAIILGLDPKTNGTGSSGWFFLYYIGAFIVLGAPRLSWLQLSLVGVALLAAFGVPAYWEGLYGQAPAAWGTGREVGPAPIALAAAALGIWYSGAVRRWIVEQRPTQFARRDPVQPKSAPPEPPRSTGSGVALESRFLRAAFLVAAVVFGAMGGLSLLGSAGSTTTPRVVTVPGSTGPFFTLPPRTFTSFQTKMNRANGADFATGVVLLLVAALALNRASRRGGGGIVDRAWLGIERAGALGRGAIAIAIAPAAVGAVAFAWFVYQGAAHTTVHWDATSAVAAFDKNGLSNELYVTGNVLYGVDRPTGITHVAHFTPALVRAIDREGIGVGAFGRDFEYPMPGLLPIALLAGLALARTVQVRRAARAAREIPAKPWLIAAGALHVYVVAWLVSAQNGLIDIDGIRPEWVAGLFGFFLPAWVVALAAIAGRSAQVDLPWAAKAGWIALLHLAALAPVAWSYRFSDAAEGSPVLLWVLLYLAAACACWWAIGARTGRQA